jgi:hypothetical protein
LTRARAVMRNPLQRPLWFAVAVVAVSSTLILPSVGGLIEDVVGKHSVFLCRHIAVTICISVILTVVVRVSHDNEVFCRRLRPITPPVAVAVIALLTISFTLSVADAPENFLPTTGRPIWLVVHWATLLTFIATTEIISASVFWRYSLRAQAWWLRISLTFFGVGAVFGICYVPLRVINIVDPTETTDALVIMAVMLPYLFRALAFSMALFQGMETSVSDWLWLHRLSPLWQALREVTPTIALVEPPSRFWEELDWRHLQFRLYRRVIEIRDGLLWLRPHLDPDISLRATEFLTGQGNTKDHDLTVAACVLEIARRSVLSGRAAPGGETVELVADSTAGTMDAEVRLLGALTKAYLSPQVAAFVRLMDRSPDPKDH